MTTLLIVLFLIVTVRLWWPVAAFLGICLMITAMMAWALLAGMVEAFRR